MPMFLRDAAGRDASRVPQHFRPRPFGPPENGSRPVPSRGRDRGTRPVPFRPVPPSNPGTGGIQGTVKSPKIVPCIPHTGDKISKIQNRMVDPISQRF